MTFTPHLNLWFKQNFRFVTDEKNAGVENSILTSEKSPNAGTILSW